MAKKVTKRVKKPMYTLIMRPGSVYVQISFAEVKKTEERVANKVNIDYDHKGNPVGYEFLDPISVSVEKQL